MSDLYLAFYNAACDAYNNGDMKQYKFLLSCAECWAY